MDTSLETELKAIPDPERRRLNEAFDDYLLDSNNF